MTWQLVVEAQARTEIAEAAACYGRRNPFARESFLAAIAEALSTIEHNPLQYQVVRGVVRRALVRHFPYALLDSIAENKVFVTVCFHTSRDRKRWQRRFPE